MNIGLMFVHEPIETDRQSKQRETDQMIEGKLGSSNIITNFIAWITGTIGGPIISFSKKWICYCSRNFRFCILI